MKILLACSKYMPEYSGAGYRAHNLYKRLTSKDSSIKLTVLAGSVSENSSMKYEYDGLEINRISCKPYPDSASCCCAYWRNFRNFQAESGATGLFLNSRPDRPDLVHVFGQSYVTVVAIDYAIKNSIPLIIELVTDLSNPFYYVPWPWSLAYSNRPLAKYCFVCISEKLMKLCLDEGIEARDIWCRPNPVDEKLFHPVGRERRSELRSKLSKFGPDDKVIAYIAKFRPSKNHIFLAEVLSHLPEEFKLIVGGPVLETGPEAPQSCGLAEELERKISELGLSGRAFVLRGFINNVAEYYQAADAYAFPSLQEGLGTPLLESIACGTPVVANRIAGVTDLWIKEGRNGFLCGSDPVEFAGKIKEAIEIPNEVRLDEAEKILKVAGNKVIDDEYLRIISRLTK